MRPGSQRVFHFIKGVGRGLSSGLYENYLFPALALSTGAHCHVEESPTDRTVRGKLEMACFCTLIFGLVVVAGFIGDSSLVCVGVDSQVISSVTRARPPAVYHVLHGQVGRRPRSPALDVDAVYHGEKKKREKH